MTGVSKFRALQPLPGVGLAVAAAIAGYAVRYGFVEPAEIGALCHAARPWWCGLRTGFIVFTEWQGFGWLSLSLAALAIVWLARGRDALPWALAALATGGAGMVLYNATLSTVAAVTAVIVLAQHRREAP